jgi:hypothetical protein
MKKLAASFVAALLVLALGPAVAFSFSANAVSLVHAQMNVGR